MIHFKDVPGQVTKVWIEIKVKDGNGKLVKAGVTVTPDVGEGWSVETAQDMNEFRDFILTIKKNIEGNND